MTRYGPLALIFLLGFQRPIYGEALRRLGVMRSGIRPRLCWFGFFTDSLLELPTPVCAMAHKFRGNVIKRVYGKYYDIVSLASFLRAPLATANVSAPQILE